MNTARINQLLQYYQEEPNDPFNIYALALEYLKLDPIKAQEYFDLLLSTNEQYVPAYYHAAKLYQDLGNKGRAIQLYEKGMQIAKQLHDLKAARELQSAYEELTFE
jgi:lipoprotein NlpI